MARMSAETTRARFAPSPTGELHLGNARTALFAWLYARSRGGTFVLRIEDTDEARSSRAHEAAMLDVLRWLGLDWDEGPDVGGAHAPYRQSERHTHYAEHLARLETASRVYPCFCSAEQLALERAAQRAAGRAPRYAGTCARLAPAAAAARRARGERAALRFRVEPGQRIAFDDLVRGPQHFASDDIGDFILRRANGSGAFLLMNALDDAVMAVTHVLRGEDHLTNTPRQLMILAALDLPAPRYGHLPLVLGGDGQPLSKREQAASLESLQRQGYLPTAVRNTLARLGHSYADDALLDTAALIAGFSLAHVSHAPGRFDPAQLRHWQHAAVLAAGEAEISDWLGADVRALVPEDARAAFVQAVQPNLVLPQDAREWAERLYGAGVMDEEARAEIRAAGREFVTAALAALRDAADLPDFLARLAAATGRRGRRLYAPLRAVLTGRMDGPELALLAAALGPQRMQERFEAHQ